MVCMFHDWIEVRSTKEVFVNSHRYNYEGHISADYVVQKDDEIFDVKTGAPFVVGHVISLRTSRYKSRGNRIADKICTKCGKTNLKLQKAIKKFEKASIDKASREALEVHMKKQGEAAIQAWHIANQSFEEV